MVGSEHLLGAVGLAEFERRALTVWFLIGPEVPKVT